MKVLFALPGFHKYDRGAEVALIAIAKELTKAGDDITLIGSGPARSGVPYRFFHAASFGRELFGSFPSLPALRTDYAYEELTFAPALLASYRPADYDATVTCSYPFTNWILRRPTVHGRRPAHIFVTQNGDWPAYSNHSEYKLFNCDGLVCTNPDFYERNQARWRCKIIPNGVDCDIFKPGAAQPELFGLPSDKLIVLMVSALIPTKRVELGIEAVSAVPDAHLVVAGNGPLRDKLEASAKRLLGDRFTLLTMPAHQMPRLYRSADVFLHLAKEEAFGNVFVEAMACGLPVVAHDSSRVRWIVGNNQFLVDTDIHEAISHGIIAAAEARLGAEAERLKQAAGFSWTKIGELYRSFLHEIVG